jgi:hypothetical protein
MSRKAPPRTGGAIASRPQPSTSVGVAPAVPAGLEIRRHAGPEALRELVAPLTLAGFLPAPIAGMDPVYLAEGFEGESPGAIVAYANGEPAAYMTYALRRMVFRPAFGRFSLGRFPYRQLRLFGYAGKEGARGPILDQFFAALLETDRWQVAQLFELPVDNPLCRYISRIPSDGDRGYCAVNRIFETIQSRIEENFESFLQSRFTKKTRYNLKREVRLLEEAAPGRIATRVYTSAEEAADFLKRCERIARRTRHWSSAYPLRVTPSSIRKVSYLAKSGRLRGYILFIGDLPVAFCYATVRWGELWCEAVGHDPQFSKLNPGKVLLYKIFEDLHECQVVRQLNFGVGTAEQKRIFGTSCRRVLDASLYKHGAYPQLLRLVAGTANGGYRHLQRLIGPWKPYLKRKFSNVIVFVVASLPDIPEMIAEIAC